MGGVVAQVQRHVPQVRPHVAVLGSHAAAQRGPQRGDGPGPVLVCFAIGRLQQQLQAPHPRQDPPARREDDNVPGGRAAPLSMPWLRSTPAYAAISSAWTGLCAATSRAAVMKMRCASTAEPAATSIRPRSRSMAARSGRSSAMARADVSSAGRALGPAGGVGVAGGGEQPLRAQVVADAQFRGTLVGHDAGSWPPRLSARAPVAASCSATASSGPSAAAARCHVRRSESAPAPASRAARVRRGPPGARRRSLPGRSPSGPVGDAP